MIKTSLFHSGAAMLGCLFYLVISAPASASAGGVYFVKAGDTLTRISRLFDVDVDSIRKVNRLGTGNISPGDRIRIPDKSPKPNPGVVVTPRQDPVAEITRHHEVSSDRVLQAVCRDETVYHSVVRGDTLHSIANRYATELDNLLQLNGLRKNSRLSIGQKILVRKSGPRTHTVGRGETLFRIASRYRIAAGEIARLNRLDGKKIIAGQRLLIEPCDPYAAAGSAPPPLGGLSTLTSESTAQSALGENNRGLSAPAAAIARRVINLARTMLNVPYRYGGSTLRGIDCSAYVQRVFWLMDIRIPRTAREQYSVGARIDRDDIQIGDLVFFRTYASFPSHVGIYLGENLFIHASSMVHKVTIDSMDLPYYRKRFIGASRLFFDGAPAVASTP